MCVLNNLWQGEGKVGGASKVASNANACAAEQFLAGRVKGVGGWGR